jgi:hypothetical protein
MPVALLARLLKLDDLDRLLCSGEATTESALRIRLEFERYNDDTVGVAYPALLAFLFVCSTADFRPWEIMTLCIFGNSNTHIQAHTHTNTRLRSQ